MCGGGGFVPESRLFCFVPHKTARVLGRPLAVLSHMLRGFESLTCVPQGTHSPPHNKNNTLSGVFF